MGNYVSSSEVLDIRAVSMVGISESSVDTLIAGVEARINSALKAQGYADVPATGSNDIAMLKEQVLKKVAALAYMAARSPGDLPGWCASWNEEFETWFDALMNGMVVLLDQTPSYPSQQALIHRLRVLPEVRDDE